MSKYIYVEDELPKTTGDYEVVFFFGREGIYPFTASHKESGMWDDVVMWRKIANTRANKLKYCEG